MVSLGELGAIRWLNVYALGLGSLAQRRVGVFRLLRLPDRPFDRCCPRIPLIEMNAVGIRGQRRTLRFYGTIPGSSAASCGLSLSEYSRYRGLLYLRD